MLETQTAQQSQRTVRAVVGSVESKGRTEFVVAYLEKGKNLSEIGPDESVTFSMSCWHGTTPPQNGQVVELSNIQKFAKGWRALSARPVMA